MNGEITDSDIRKIITKKFRNLSSLGKFFEIDSCKKGQVYRIIFIVDDKITLQGINPQTKEWSVTFKLIKDAYRNKIWEGKQYNGLDPYRAAIAKYIYHEIEEP